MATQILSTVANWIMGVISSLNYGGVIILMAINSANVPIPSEVIMPFSGFLVAQGTMNLWLVGIAGAVGCVIGSVFSYYLGYLGGRPLIEKYGKYILISHHDLNIADKWFGKYGEITVFFGRFVPVVTTFISFPAGIARMKLSKFIIYSFLGSLVWATFLAFIGKKLGDNWERLRGYFHSFDWIILVFIAAGIVWWVWRHSKNRKLS